MAKLVIQAPATFPAIVEIPLHGNAGVAEICVTFKHRKRDELAKFMAAQVGRAYEDTILDIATGWDLSDPFTLESLRELLENHAGAGECFTQAYLHEHTKARVKN